MHGKFIWYELMTTDVAGAANFYSKIVGWDVADSGQTDKPYSILSINKYPIGGLLTLPEEARKMGARPGWLGYIAVDDVDAYAIKVSQAGGKVYKGPEDIPNVGRFAVVADPQGAAFYLFKGMGEPPPSPPPATDPGQVCWRELHAGDREPAFAFYAGLFGWEKGAGMDMGPMGLYQLYRYAGGSDDIGGMMTKLPVVPMPFWLYYIGVPDFDLAIKTITANGGTLLNGPQPVPGDAWIVQALDPQGAMFALVGARKA
jgi:predicted enzyme related to lactoylglutathione lyase